MFGSSVKRNSNRSSSNASVIVSLDTETRPANLITQAEESDSIIAFTSIAFFSHLWARAMVSDSDRFIALLFPWPAAHWSPFLEQVLVSRAQHIIECLIRHTNVTGRMSHATLGLLQSELDKIVFHCPFIVGPSATGNRRITLPHN